jgi:hypothetical protein
MPVVVSKYFDKFRHAGMAKRKIADDMIVAPKRSCQATHSQNGADQNDSSSEVSDANNDSWYCSDDGKFHGPTGTMWRDMENIV